MNSISRIFRAALACAFTLLTIQFAHATLSVSIQSPTADGFVGSIGMPYEVAGAGTADVLFGNMAGTTYFFKRDLCGGAIETYSQLPDSGSAWISGLYVTLVQGTYSRIYRFSSIPTGSAQAFCFVSNDGYQSSYLTSTVSMPQPVISNLRIVADAAVAGGQKLCVDYSPSNPPISSFYWIENNIIKASGSPAELWTTYVCWNRTSALVAGQTYNVQLRYNGSSSLTSNTLSITVPQPAPAMPANITATQNSPTYPGQIMVSWSAAANATSYEVFRFNADWTSPTFIGWAGGSSTSNQTWFLDTPPAVSVPYNYQVIGYSYITYQVGPGGSASTTGIAAPLALTSAVQGFTASNIYLDRIQLGWSTLNGASSYEIQRTLADPARTLDGASITVSPGTASAYADTVPPSGSARCYKIRGVNIAGNGPWSTEACGTRTLLTVPPLTVSQGSLTGVTRLTWSAPSTYVAAQSQIWRLRSTADLTDWELLATLPGSTLTYDDTSPRGADSVADFYRLHQTDAAGNAGGWTMTSTSNYTANIGAGYANLAPTSLSAAITASANQVSAPATLIVTDPNVTAGQVESFSYAPTAQPASGQGTCTVVGNKVTWSPDPSFGFSGVTTCTVRVTDKGSATVQGLVTITVNPVVPGVPGGVNATDGTVTGAVNITWSGATNASSYIVYRNGTQIGTSVTTSASDLSPADATVYSYRVAAMSSSGAISAQSSADSGYANVAPTSLSASINATANAGGSAQLIVNDANFAAGQPETFTFVVVSDPGQGQGYCTVSGNTVSWVPPLDFLFVGDLTCQVTVTDRGGASLVGTVTVHVTPTIPGVPSNVAATDGTLTGRVGITWSSSLNANTYRVLRNGIEIGNTPTTSFTDTTPVLATVYSYKVVAVSVSAGQSSDSSSDTGYANLAPTAVSATINNAVSNAASAYAVPVVIDPNVSAGQTESFTLTVITQPASGQGTCEATTSGVRWVPPVTLDFYGPTSCTVSVRDRGGDSVTGLVTIAVAAYIPPAPTGVVATDGTINGKVGVTWNPVPGALSYVVVRAPTATGPTWTQIASSVTTNIVVDVADATPAFYAVRTVGSSGAPSVNSTSDSGYPNLAPVSAVVAITTAADVTSTPKAPTVTDPNGAQVMTFVLLTQPANGQGTVALTGSGLFTYTPPASAAFTGLTTFTFSATDPGGLSVIGVGNVTVTAATPDTPTGVIASKGTITGGVKIDWSAANKAASYDVYRAGVKVNDTPVTALTFTYPTTSVLTAAFAVRSVSSSGGLSAISGPDSGYANLAPTSTSFTGAAVANAANANIGSITTVDPNKLAGQVEVFQYSPSTIATALGGSVTIASNGSVFYTAPSTVQAQGADSFNYTVTDKGGAAVAGVGTVDVCFAPLLDAVNASTTDLSGAAQARACNGALTITHSFRVRVPGESYSSLATRVITTLAASLSASSAARNFTSMLSGALLEPGQYEVTSQVVDAIGQSSAPRISFYEIGCAATPNAISLGAINVDYLAAGGVANSAVGALRACQQNGALSLSAATQDAPTVVVATASSNAASPVPANGGSIVWAMPAMNAGNYIARLRLTWTFGNVPGETVIEKPFSVTCPDPVVGKVGRAASNPDLASVNFWVPMCADGAAPMVSFTVNAASATNGSLARSSASGAVGSGSMYVYTSELPNGPIQYSLQIVDSANRTNTVVGTLSARAATGVPSLVSPSGNTTDSLGKIRVIPAAGGPQRPAN